MASQTAIASCRDVGTSAARSTLLGRSCGLRCAQAYEQNKGGVPLMEGNLIERPVISAARRTLAIAEAVQSESQA